MNESMPTGDSQNSNEFASPDVQVEQFPSPDNPLVPHSGHAGVERPVREFDNTTLEEAHGQGLIVTPNSPAELPPAHNPNSSRTKRLIIGGTLAAVGIVGVAFGVGRALGGDHESNEPNSEPVATATPNPGETPTDAPTPTGGETQAPTSILTELDNKPNQQQIDDALKPVTVDEYPDAASALTRLGEIWKTISLSGDVNLTTYEETPESADLRDQLINNLAGSSDSLAGSLATEITDQLKLFRRNMAMELYFAKDNVSWQQTWSSSDLAEVSPGQYQGSMTVETTTDIQSYDVGASKLFPDMVPHRLSHNTVTITQVDGVWKLADVGPATDIQVIE